MSAYRKTPPTYPQHWKPTGFAQYSKGHEEEVESAGEALATLLVVLVVIVIAVAVLFIWR